MESSPLWGSKTSKALDVLPHKKSDCFDAELIRSLAIVKRSAAKVHLRAGTLSIHKATLISNACDHIISGECDENFPLSVYQTLSGSAFHFNIIEVIESLIRIASADSPGKGTITHDDINLMQSSNDCIPTAIHIASAVHLVTKVLPALRELENSLENRMNANDGESKQVITSGRTHLMNALPISYYQVLSGYKEMITSAIHRITTTLPQVLELTQGGTAVGTGAMTFPGFDYEVVKEIAAYTNLPFTVTKNKFKSQGCHDSLVDLHSVLTTASTSLMRMATDIAFLSSSCMREINLVPQLRGSTIMPGKCFVFKWVAHLTVEIHYQSFSLTQARPTLSIVKR